MTAHPRTEPCERGVRTVKYDARGSLLDEIDADQTPVHSGVNRAYPIEKLSHTTAEALDSSEFIEVQDSYVVDEEMLVGGRSTACAFVVCLRSSIGKRRQLPLLDRYPLTTCMR